MSSGKRVAGRKRSVGFWIFLVLFAIALIVFWVFIVRYVNKCMVTFEAAQPEYVAEKVVQSFKDGSALNSMTFAHSRFEDESIPRSAYAALLNGQEISCRKAPGSYSTTTPTYEIMAGNTPVAKVSLREKSSQVLMLILTLQEWEVAEVVPKEVSGEAWEIVAPDTCAVFVNGQQLGEGDLTGERFEMEEFQYAANYVAVPALVEYRVEGLFKEPVIEIRDSQDRVLEPTETDGRRVATQTFLTSDMPEELASQVLKNAKDYSNFFSRDLAGSTASTRPIRYMFPADSYYLELAENYRLHDMWMYATHHAPVFSEEQVSNYIRYSEDLFSCEVYFDKKMVLSSNGQARHDVTHNRYYYVNLDGKWVIADMQQILDGTP